MAGADEKNKRIEELAAQVLSLSRDSIMVNLRFLDVAMTRLQWVSKPGIGSTMTDGVHLYYDSVFLLKEYEKEPAATPRRFLHMLLHCIFHHPFGAEKLEEGLWNLAVDIAVEDAILSMDLPGFAKQTDDEAKRLLARLKNQVPVLTAEKLYRHFRVNGPSHDYEKELKRLFYVDSHESWHKQEEIAISLADWQRISERVKADLKSFSRGKTGEGELDANLTEAVREHYDYGAILQRFMVMGEDVTPSPDEFDYIYYTYGLSKYGNMPLIEPLEYRESKRVREFVIVLDTSASCRGELVKGFLRKTYDLLKGSENFFTRINVHIIQCDHQVRSDEKIEKEEDFEAFLQKGKLVGAGATDFTPAFAYVEELKVRGEFENLKGLIYFTDGYGSYPERMPDYEVVFAFLNEDENRPAIPPWALKAVLDEEELERIYEH